MKLSIIIATHKRAAILRACLEHLEKQTIAEDLEVIVVSDGPDSETRQICQSANLPICFSEVEKSQQGVARNFGLKHATAPYVMYLNDDIFLEPDACEKHIDMLSSRAESRGPALTLGFVTWDPSLKITPVMRWLEESGWQFGYPMIEKFSGSEIPADLQHRFTYTCQISLPREIAEAHPFREDVTLYGWEDIEWGMRLQKSGIPLIYEPSAKGFHHHFMSLEDSLKRMETLGRSIVHISSIVLEIDRRPRGLKLFLYHLASLLPTMAGRHRKAFLRGIRNSI